MFYTAIRLCYLSDVWLLSSSSLSASLIASSKLYLSTQLASYDYLGSFLYSFYWEYCQLGVELKTYFLFHLYVASVKFSRSCTRWLFVKSRMIFSVFSGESRSYLTFTFFLVSFDDCSSLSFGFLESATWLELLSGDMSKILSLAVPDLTRRLVFTTILLTTWLELVFTGVRNLSPPSQFRVSLPPGGPGPWSAQPSVADLSLRLCPAERKMCE